MTKVITRLFESPEQALKVRRELVQQERLSVRIVHLYDTADGLSDTLTAAHVDAKTAKTYQERVGAGGAVLMVQAGYRPLAVATTTREVMARMGALDLSPLIEEVEVEDAPETRMSVLSGAPLMLSRERDPYATDFHMADWPIPLISRRKPFTYTVLPPHAKFAGWPLAHISKRKPYTGSIVGRHSRMASFPIPLISFPHLINGKTGTNALIPGAPRMANFPIPLLSKRTPNTASIFPRHARMANFPISLISKRKPYTGSLFPKHARMADMILPLVIKRQDNPRYGSERFSLSRMFGLPTLIKR